MDRKPAVLHGSVSYGFKLVLFLTSDTEAFVSVDGEERILRIIIQHVLYQIQWNFDIIYVNRANFYNRIIHF